MTDFSNSVIMPREDFVELSTAAYDQTPMTPGQRVASTVHSSAVVLGIAGAVVAGSWGWAKAVDWLEERRLARDIAKRDHMTTPKVK